MGIMRIMGVMGVIGVRWSLLAVVASMPLIQFTTGVEALTKTIEQKVQPDGATVNGLISDRVGCHKGGRGSV